MSWQLTPFVVVGFTGSVLLGALSLFAWRRRPAPGAKPLAILLLAVAEWSLAHTVQLASADLSTQSLLVKIQYLGAVSTPVAWLAFALGYTRRGGWLTPRNILLLAIEPALTLVLAWTHPQHDLMWRTTYIGGAINYPARLGPWFWVNRGYSYVLLLGGLVLLFKMSLRAPHLHRRQILALVVAALAPLTGEMLILTGSNPWPDISLTSFSLSVSSLVATWGFFSYRLFDIVPAAREAVIESMSDGVIVLDAEDRVVDLNPAAERLLGRARASAVGLPAAEAFCLQPSLVKTYRAISSAQREFAIQENARMRHFDLRASLLHDRRGQVTGRLLVLLEITERKRAEEALRQSEERYALAAQGANDGLWDWDLRTNRIYFSTRWKAMLGYDNASLGDDPEEWLARIHPADIDAARELLEAHLGGLTPNFRSEHRILHSDRSYRWVLSRGLAVRDSAGRAYRMAGSLTDITERKQAEERLVHDALHDSLTGLENRAMFMERLRSAFARSRRDRTVLFSVLFLDLDRFKLVNDTLGHAAGDQLIIAVARRLKDSLREVDSLARLGGDEFVILLDGIGEGQEAIRAAQRILDRFKAPFQVDGREIFTSASIGIALSDSNHAHPELLLRNADLAMYRAKQLGKSRYAVFDEGMWANTLRTLQLEAEVRRAIEGAEFELYYQPIVSLTDFRVFGCEALVRWFHPEHGQIPPLEFIPVADESDLILQLGYWIIGEACRQAGAWRSSLPTDQPLAISVNLSGRQLRDPHLPEQIRHSLRSAGLGPGDLCLEITESAFTQDAELASAVLTQLKSIGVQVHMDNFGTRQAPLSALYSLPVDAIKIDHSFVRGIQGSEPTSEILRSIVGVGRALKKVVIAKGIERQEELEFLRAAGCQYGQGIYFSEPISGPAVVPFVQALPSRESGRLGSNGDRTA